MLASILRLDDGTVIDVTGRPAQGTRHTVLLVTPRGLDLGRAMFIALLGAGPAGLVARNPVSRSRAGATGYIAGLGGSWQLNRDEQVGRLDQHAPRAGRAVAAAGATLTTTIRGAAVF